MSSPSEALVDYWKRLEGDVMIIGAGGKIGPTMALMAKRAVDVAGVHKEVIAVDVQPLAELEGKGIRTLQCDLLDRKAVGQLPRVKNIVFMAGRKFGSSGNEWLTWAINVMVPTNVAEVGRDSAIAVFSTGCVYPVVDVYTGGSIETDAVRPIGEYAMSCLGRERVFDFYAAEKGTKVVQIRLNYALELRYGVLVDIATKVYREEPVDVTTGYMNGIWQGDCCDQVLRSFQYAASPSAALNVTGPELLSVRWIAQRFGELFGKQARIAGEENGKAYLSNAAKANALFGNPSVPIGRVIEWIADWIQRGGESLGKPTHFETQDGKY
ncbi:MAG TPA: NAD-dependent epimerase/dehydratase family protein [Bacteroidota bacterium]|nr:NAD-dependent epimerase/dehydratase family protein [Bacteroidota bacterium]